MTVIENMGKKAKDASRVLATAGAIKNKALNAVADALIDNTDKIVKANDIDLENGKAAYINLLEDGEVAFGSTEYIVFAAKDRELRKRSSRRLSREVHKHCFWKSLHHERYN